MNLVSDLLTAVACVAIGAFLFALSGELADLAALAALVGGAVFATLGLVFSIASGVRLGTTRA